jgi:cytochrome d ubiquinol oxidase subunit I
VDPVLLSRIQFGVTASFHYIYPPLSIGLGVVLVLMEIVYLRTQNPVYEQMTRFWVRIFGLTFAMGVASGIVLEFEFGTNWARYSRYVGDVFGSALAAEGIFAFFLESGFLALLLFGWNKVKPTVHFLATVLVALGAHFSAIWIVVANSWMQTPAGHHIVTEDGRTRAEITDFAALVFNPSSMTRLTHTLFGCWQAGAFLVASVSAYYLLRRRHEEVARMSLILALAVAAAAGVGSALSGHQSGVVVARHQPAKLAAMEAHFGTGPADLNLVGWVDEKNERVHGPRVPGLLSWLVTGDPEASLPGLEEFPVENRPPVQAVFQAFHAMVAIGSALLALSLVSLAFLRRGRLFRSRGLLRLLVIAVLGPQIANQLGWFTAEVGRQPWIVQDLLRTADGVSETVTGGDVLVSLVLFTSIYLGLLVLFLFLLDRKIRHGPLEEDLDVARQRASA